MQVVEAEGAESSRALAHQNLRVANARVGSRDRQLAAMLQDSSEVAGRSRTSVQHGLDACPNRSDWQNALHFVALAPAIASSRRLPRHPLRLLGQRQHVLPWDEPHPALPLRPLLLRHLAHVDGVTSPGILHCELVVLWCVVVDGVVRIVLWCMVAVIPC